MMESPFKTIEKKEENLVSQKDLLIYYSEHYPSKLIINWLCRNNIKLIKNREFCFTLPNDEYNDKYVRFQSFETIKQFENRIKKLIPIKIDIGAIYDKEPRNRAEHKLDSDLFFQEKELVFDIDMKDYDDVRTCCKENNICDKCWKYIICGAKILDKILKEDFGFKKYFFDFSGRRGIHCWVCDKKACKLKDEGRKMIENFISFDRANDEYTNSIFNRRIIKRKFVDPIYPLFLEEISLIKNDFDVILKEQDLLNYGDIKKLFKDIIKMYFGWMDMKEIDDILKKKINSLDKFNNIYEYLKKAENMSKKRNIILYYRSESCINEFILSVISPRLDWKVTRESSHLLKGPFCVHPKTGYVSVPMSLKLLEKFDLRKIPKIDNLINKNPDDIEYFKQYRQFFENFVNSLNNNEEEEDE